MVLHNQLCQSLYDGTLTHTGLTYQDRVVLLSAPEYLDDALYLLLAPHARVEFPFGSSPCQVCTKRVEHRCLRGWLRLNRCSPRCGGAASLSGSILKLVLFLVGQADTVLYLCILRGEQHRHSVFIIHVVQF